MKSSDDLAKIRNSYPKNKVYMIVSARIFHETGFFTRWEEERLSPLIDGYLVVIDMDPFHLIRSLSENELIAVNRGNVRVPEGGETRMLEFVCLSNSTQANLIYFTPCSGPFLDVLTTYCQSESLNIIAGCGLTAEHSELLKKLAGHVVREEPKFGFDFWE